MGTALIALNDCMFSTVFFFIVMNVSFVFVDTNYWQFHYRMDLIALLITLSL